MKNPFNFLIILLFMGACSSNPNQEAAQQEQAQPEVPQKDEKTTMIETGKGVGEVKNVPLTDPLDEQMIAKGKAIYEMKCSACHKLTDQRVVGPGWQGVTNRRKPEWIMNMITNVDMMLAEDPAAQQMLEECLTQMPNQNITVDDAREILEFMRQNDVEKAGEKDQAAG
jgi:cytochrome c2